MFCPHCGTSLPDGTRFCTECGARILNPPPAQGVADANQASGSPGMPAMPTQQSQPTGKAEPFGQPNAQQTNRQEYRQPPQPSPVSSQADAQVTTGPLTTNREIVSFALLTIVTCGIYGYWYIYQMAQDANVLCAEDGEETPGLAIYILLSIVTCGIYSYYWQYKLANRLQNNGYRYGVQVQEGGSDVLIWLILGALLCIICSYVGTNIIFKNMNELCAAYNRMHGYEG